MLPDNATSPPRRLSRNRKKRQQRRLLNTLLQVFEGDDRFKPLGRDPLLGAMIDARFEVKPRVAAYQFLLEGGARTLTVVAVPDRLWNQPAAMTRLLDAKKCLAKFLRHCVLLPQSALGKGGTAANVPGSVLQALHEPEVHNSDFACPAAPIHDPVGCTVKYLVTGSACTGPNCAPAA